MKLEFSDEKTLITHSQKAAKFLGYAVLANRSNLAKRDNTGRLSRVYNKKVLLRISMETIKKKLLDFGVLEVKTHNGKEHWKPREHRKIICNDNLEILQKYNYTIRGFHNYYAIANNSSLLNSYKYIMEYSMYKTFAGKYKSKVSANINKMVYSLYNIRAVREERSNRHFTTKVSQEEKPEIGENIDILP